jgi:DNA-binding IclR family transcriptional regulator
MGAATEVPRNSDNLPMPAVPRRVTHHAAGTYSKRVGRIVTSVGVLDKAVQLLDIVEVADSITVNELIRQSGLPKTTVHRLVSALEAHGFLRRDDGGLLTHGVRVTALNLPLLAKPVLRSLTAETGESSQLYVRRGNCRLVIVSVESALELRATVPVGALLPLDRGAPGRVVTGDLETLKRGWAQSVGEREPGVSSVSAPVYAGGVVVAALAISGPSTRLGTDAGERYATAVCNAARRLERSMHDEMRLPLGNGAASAAGRATSDPACSSSTRTDGSACRE